MKKNPLIAITMGDPGGIGPEVILKSCLSREIYTLCRPVIIGSAAVLEYYRRRFTLDIKIITAADIVSISDFSPDRLYIIDVLEYSSIVIGGPTKKGGYAAGLCIEKAVDLAMDGKVDAIATAPISKDGLNRGGYKYAGHTEMLADITGAENVAMMLAGDDIRVVLTTTHASLKDVSSLLNISKIETMLDIIAGNMFYFGLQSSKIGVSSLNPHNGEGGLLGREEEEIIIPAICNARERGVDADGPFPADTLFVEENRKRFDVILVMYHDQGLIPLKMMAFGKSVNITLGLPVIRTSVDHGTAYDIAGRNIADPSSMKEALKTASMMVKAKRLNSKT